VSDGATPDASLIAHDGAPRADAAGLTYPWGDSVPASGQTIRMAPSLSWARLPMPGSLGHINSWLLDADDGAMTIVDTGVQMRNCSDEWKALFAGDLAGRRVDAVLCTHMHPDHIGLAGWLAKRHDAPILMTRAEWLTARLMLADMADTPPPEVAAMQHASGWDEAMIAASAASGWSRMARIVHPLPHGYRRIRDGDVLDIGPHRWRVVVGSGHSPEHACLLNEVDGVLVSGDQVLPRISSNVSMHSGEPDADPLGDWLASIDRLLELDDALLVCPAHGEPFRGLHARLIALRDEHHARLDALVVALAAPHRVIDCFPYLFRRTIGDQQRGLATGEALAHLRYLEVTGRAVRETQDGVWWWRAA
jgi:glyoxylase-like metal-dependent hydrolase (beta-lactamase superfamily II)